MPILPFPHLVCAAVRQLPKLSFLDLECHAHKRRVRIARVQLDLLGAIRTRVAKVGDLGENHRVQTLVGDLRENQSVCVRVCVCVCVCVLTRVLEHGHNSHSNCS